MFLKKLMIKFRLWRKRRRKLRQQRKYYWEHREEILAKRRAKRAIHKSLVAYAVAGEIVAPSGRGESGMRDER